MLKLIIVPNSYFLVHKDMRNHYSQPKGFVGRNIVYAIFYNGLYYGSIVSGSATKYLPNRNKFFGIDEYWLNNIINNTFFHIERVNNNYPCRNFIPLIIKTWEQQTQEDWFKKYNNIVLGFESLIEPPRTGQSYMRCGWKKIGTTMGYTCKRIAGRGTDSYTGQRIWHTNELKPKLIFCKKV